MKKTGAGLFLLIVMTIISFPAFAQSLPNAPKGFRWARVPEIKAAFLVPTGWHFKAEKKQNTLAYFISREKIDRSGEFKTGLTVNVIPRVKGRDSVSYAKEFIAAFSEKKKLLKSWDTNLGKLVGSGCLVADEKTTMNIIMLGNTETNTLYLFMFEAPQDEWDTAWKFGQVIMHLLAIDDEI